MADPPSKLDRARQELEEKDSLRIRMRTIFNRAFQFREGIWNDEEKFWENAKDHPLKFKARFADMTNVFNKPWAAKMMESEEGEQPRDKLTAEKLEAMDLSDDQIEKLAAVNEEPEEK